MQLPGHGRVDDLDYRFEDRAFLNMPNYRLLFFQANRLDRWEEFEADTFVEAVQRAAERAGNDMAELWTDHGRIATFRPRRTHGKSGDPL